MILSLSILVIVGAGFLAFNVLVASGQVYQANYAELQAKDASNQLRNLGEIHEDMIPDLCQYLIFSEDGHVKSGNINTKGQKAAWAAVEENRSNKGTKFDGKGNYYMVISRDGEYLVLRYQIIPQYRSAALRRILLPPQNLFIVCMLLLILLSVACTAFGFGHALKETIAFIGSYRENSGSGTGICGRGEQY